MTNIIGTPPEAVYVGQRVGVVFTPTDDGTALPRFQPV
jgi:hypothetical protein